MRQHQHYLLSRAVLVEGGLLAIALVWAFFGKIPLRQMCAPLFSYMLFGLGLGGILLAVNAVTLHIGSRYFAWCRRIKYLMEHDVAPLFRGFSITGALLLALMSGISEEVLFRGVLQAQIGLAGASILFGLAHVWRKDTLVYGVYAAFIGVVLGSVYMLTHNLWTPIVAHVVNNFVAILYCGHTSQCVDEHTENSKEVDL